MADSKVCCLILSNTAISVAARLLGSSSSFGRSNPHLTLTIVLNVQWKLITLLCAGNNIYEEGLSFICVIGGLHLQNLFAVLI